MIEKQEQHIGEDRLLSVLPKSPKYQFSTKNKEEHRVIYIGDRNEVLESFLTEGIDGNFLSASEPSHRESFLKAEAWTYECPSEVSKQSYLLEITMVLNSFNLHSERFLEKVNESHFVFNTSGRSYIRPFRCCLLAFDVTSRYSFQLLPIMQQVFQSYFCNDWDPHQPTKIVVIGTVPSSEGASEKRQVSALEAECFATRWGGAYFELSKSSSPELLHSLQATIYQACQASQAADLARQAEISKRYNTSKQHEQKRKSNRCIIM